MSLIMRNKYIINYFKRYCHLYIYISKILYYQTTLNEGVKEASLWNGSWTYREKLSDSDGGTFSGVTELPWSRIVISGDKNNDDLVD